MATMNVTMPTTFIIAAPSMVGSLPAALVCYILYGLGAFLPVALIVVVAIVFGCRRRLRKSKSVVESDAGDDRLPEIRKTENNNVGNDAFDTLNGFPFPLSSSPPLSLDLISETTQSVENPNVYFRQSPVKLAPSPAAMDDFRELNSGSTMSFGGTSLLSSASRSTLQIRKLNEDQYTMISPTPIHQIGRLNKPEMDVHQPEVNWTREDASVKPFLPLNASQNVDRVRITNGVEYLDTDQEKALRYLDEVNDNLEQDLGDTTGPFSVNKQDGVSHEGRRVASQLNGRQPSTAGFVTHF